jgi:chromosome segregation ATPase
MNSDSLTRITAFADDLSSVLKSASKNQTIDKKIVELEDELREANSKVQIHEETIRMMYEEKEEIMTKLQSSNSKVDELGDTLHEVNLKVNELSNVGHCLNTQLLSCRREKMQLDLTIIEKDKRIKALEDQLECMKVAIEALIPK